MKTKNILYLLVGLVLFCNSCSEISKEIPQTNVNTVNATKYLIGEQESILVAKDFLSKSYPLTKSSQENLRSNVQVIYRSISTNTNQSVSTKSSTGYESIPVYIINFSTSDDIPQGYVVEVGDRRVLSNILAFSDSGIYDVTGIPEFEQIFFERIDTYIASEIENNSELFANDDPCDTSFLKEITSITDKKCNMNLTWNQRPSPYNDSLPPCTIGRVPAGCVAVAIAQIMAYYEKPSIGNYTHPINQSKITTSYNWSGMKSAPTATSVSAQHKPMIANLLAEIGDKTDMNYGCNGSGSYLSNAKNCFVSMGYKEPTIASYQFENVMREINTMSPVYMRGSDPTEGGGHAWVVEGYKSNSWEEIMVRECPNNVTEKTPTGINGSNDYLYFNLGWNGSSNGYYLAEAFSVKASGSYVYTYGIQTLTNIRPN